MKYPNGIRTRRDFDDIDRLTKLVHERVYESGGVEVLASWAIERDRAGNPEKIVRENGDEWKMEHDLADRLTRVALPRDLLARLRAKDPAKGKGKPERDDDEDDDEDAAEKLMRVGEVVYRYDAAHNRKEEDYGGRVVRSEFNDADEMTRRGSMTFKYNERGDQTEKVHKSGRREVFGFSSSGKLASYATGHKNSRHLKEVERYLYTPDGERVVVEEVQGKKLQFAHWDGSRQIEEWHEVGHGAGKKEKGHLYTRDLGGQLLEQARFTRRGGRTAHASEDDDFDEWDGDDDRRGDDGWRYGPRKPKLNHVRFVLEDFLGSAALVTNHRGRVLDRREFGPFGVPLAGNFKKMPWGYTGHRAEAQTGHWSSLHRQLDPRAGRWTQRDPLEDVDGLNRFVYVRNRPVVATDLQGLTIRMSGAVPDQLLATVFRSRVGAELFLEMNRRIEWDIDVKFLDSAALSFTRWDRQLLTPEEARLKIEFSPRNYSMHGGETYRTEETGQMCPKYRVKVFVYNGTMAALGLLSDETAKSFISGQPAFQQGAWSLSRVAAMTRPPERSNHVTDAIASIFVHELKHVWLREHGQAGAGELEPYRTQFLFLKGLGY